MIDITDATRAAARLKAEGRWPEAIAAYEAIVQAFPTQAVAFHNLASTLGDAGRAAESERAARHAMRLGLGAPETRLVCARAVQSQGRFDEAEQWLREALKRRPLYLDALRDLAQLRWMCTASSDEAVRPVDTALRAAPREPELVLLKAQVLGAAGDAAAGLDLLRQASAALPGHGRLAHALASAALQAGEVAESLAAAERAMGLAPDESATHVTWIDALLVLGEWRRAEQAALARQARSPLDQHLLARLATVWRLLGDARYGQLYDYDGLVSVLQLATPPGWATLGDFLADLEAVLHDEHRYRTHPFQQSIRQGSQVANVLQLPHPATQALAFAIDGPIVEHLARLGSGGDPVRGLNRGGYATRGGWSIRMQAGGVHVNHVHPEGWISTACYVERPAALEGREGFLKLGEPGIPLSPLPPAERFIEPQLGRIVLFPSYMWHGTVPFTTAGTRMSVAFDIVPGPAGATGPTSAPAGSPRRGG
jgi:tetratricopeptide (TPR) repeat protein